MLLAVLLRPLAALLRLHLEVAWLGASESLEFDEVMQALQKSPEIDVWEVFGRALINSS